MNRLSMFSTCALLFVMLANLAMAGFYNLPPSQIQLSNGQQYSFSVGISGGTLQSSSWNIAGMTINGEQVSDLFVVNGCTNDSLQCTVVASYNSLFTTNGGYGSMMGFVGFTGVGINSNGSYFSNTVVTQATITPPTTTTTYPTPTAIAYASNTSVIAGIGNQPNGVSSISVGITGGSPDSAYQSDWYVKAPGSNQFVNTYDSNPNPIFTINDAGWVFGSYIGGGQLTTGTYEFMDAITDTGATTTYTFNSSPVSVDVLQPAPQMYTLNMQDLYHPNGGAYYVTPTSGSSYEAGTLVQISINVPSDFVFVGWVGTGLGSYTGNSLSASIRMDNNITEFAYYYPSTVGLYVNSSDGGVVGIIPQSGTPYNCFQSQCTYFVPYNYYATLTAVPVEGYSFVKWACTYNGQQCGSNFEVSGTDGESITLPPAMLYYVKLNPVFAPSGPINECNQMLLLHASGTSYGAAQLSCDGVSVGLRDVINEGSGAYAAEYNVYVNNAMYEGSTTYSGYSFNVVVGGQTVQVENNNAYPIPSGASMQGQSSYGAAFTELVPISNSVTSPPPPSGTTVYVGNSITEGAWTIELASLGIPDASNMAPANFNVYYNGANEGLLQAYPAGDPSATSIAGMQIDTTNGNTMTTHALYINVTKTFPGLYSYQKWASINVATLNVSVTPNTETIQQGQSAAFSATAAESGGNGQFLYAWSNESSGTTMSATTPSLTIVGGQTGTFKYQVCAIATALAGIGSNFGRCSPSYMQLTVYASNAPPTTYPTPTAIAYASNTSVIAGVGGNQPNGVSSISVGITGGSPDSAYQSDWYVKAPGSNQFVNTYDSNPNPIFTINDAGWVFGSYIGGGQLTTGTYEFMDAITDTGATTTYTFNSSVVNVTVTAAPYITALISATGQASQAGIVTGSNFNINNIYDTACGDVVPCTYFVLNQGQSETLTAEVTNAVTSSIDYLWTTNTLGSSVAVNSNNIQCLTVRPLPPSCSSWVISTQQSVSVSPDSNTIYWLTVYDPSDKDTNFAMAGSIVYPPITTPVTTTVSTTTLQTTSIVTTVPTTTIGPTTLVSYTVNFNKGWNLFSVPMAYVSSVSTDTGGGSCQSSDFSGGPYTYSNGAYQNANQLYGYVGYWVYANNACSLEFYGPPISSGAYLSSGWNLIGGPSTNLVTLSSVEGTCSVTSGPFSYDSSSSTYYSSDSLASGVGYFVYVNGGCELGAPANGQTPPPPP